jgi:hypothetical protein
MVTHPFQKPFGTAFVEKKRTIRQGLNSPNDIFRDVAKFGDFFSGEHKPRVIQGDIVKLFLVMHKNFPPSKWSIRPSQIPVDELTTGLGMGRLL